MHSYFYPTNHGHDRLGSEYTLLFSYAAGVFLGSVLAVPFTDPSGRELCLSLLSSERSAGICVLWLTLPLIACILFSQLSSRLPLALLPAALGIPFGYCVFLMLRFLGAEGMKGSILLLGASAAAYPGLFWLLARCLRDESHTPVQDLVTACVMCLVPGLAVESLFAPVLREFVNAISM